MAKVPTQRKTDYVISYAFSLSIRNWFSLAILVQQNVVHPGNHPGNVLRAEGMTARSLYIFITNLPIINKIEQDNCFIIQQIPITYHFQNEKNYSSMIKTLNASNT